MDDTAFHDQIDVLEFCYWIETSESENDNLQGTYCLSLEILYVHTKYCCHGVLLSICLAQ